MVWHQSILIVNLNGGHHWLLIRSIALHAKMTWAHPPSTQWT